MKRTALLLALALLIGAVFSSCAQNVPKQPYTPDEPNADVNTDDTSHEDERKEEEFVPMGYLYEKYLEEDRKLVNAQTITSYASTNMTAISGNVRGIVIDFPEFENDSRKDIPDYAASFASLGILVARVTTGPWNWGGAGSVRYADLVVDAVKEKYGLDESTPIVATGKGMGATAALLYAANSRHYVSACAAQFPCIDIERSFECEKKYPRTFVSTVYTYAEGLGDALESISLIENAKNMPDIPYYFVGASEDELFDSRALDKFAKELKDRGVDVTCKLISGASHGEISASESAKLEAFIKKQATVKVSPPERKEYDADKNVTAFSELGAKAGLAYEKYAAEDAKYVNFDTLSLYTRNNIRYLEGEVKGIVVEFPGFGGSSCLGGNVNMGEYSTEFAKNAGKQGILVMYMYCGPWSWGNKGVVRLADLVVDALKKHYELPDGIPVVSTGGSMGGLGALVYTHDSRHNVVACMAACPGINIPKCYHEAAHRPSAMLSAVASYDMPIAEALRTISPYDNFDTMPKVPYYVVCNENDSAFDAEEMKGYVEEMKGRGLDVTFKFLPGTSHGEFTDEERVSYQSFIIDAVLGK